MIAVPGAKSGGRPGHRRPFFGRADELAALSARFAAGDRVVTILGLGGAGKTTLARRYVETCEAARCMVCELEDAASAADVLRAVVAALGQGGAPSATVAEESARTGRLLAGAGPCLFLLDGVERAVAHVAGLLGGWAKEAPEVRFLLTSRRRLLLSDEAVLELAGLDEAAAQELFLARAAQAGARAEGVDRAALAGLLGRLDRLPLSIELAAAHARARSIPGLTAALERRSALLRARARDAPARRASEQVILDEAWDSLDAPLRSLLVQLSVFDGPFSVEEAERVVELSAEGHPGAVADAIEALRDRALLSTLDGADPSLGAPGEARLRLLDTVRDYVSGRDHEAALGASRRHAALYVARGVRLAAGLETSQASRCLLELSAARPHLLGVRRRLGGVDPALAVEAALCVGAFDGLRSPAEALCHLLDEAAAIAEAAGDHVRLSRVLFARAKGRGMRGLYSLAMADFERAAAAARQAGDAEHEGRAVYGQVATLHETREDPPRALALARGVMEAAASASNEPLLARATSAAASAAGDCGLASEARGLFAQSIELLRRLDLLRTLSITLGNLATFEEEQGNLGDARQRTLEAIAAAEQGGDEVLRGKLLLGLSRVCQALGQLDEAARLLDEVDALARQTGDIETSAFVALEAGKRLLLAGQRERGERLFDAAARENARMGSKRLERDVEAARALGRPAAREIVRASAHGYWFERRGSSRVELYRRRALRRILAALCESHGLRPGVALPVAALIEAGWPGERVHPESGAMRVWTAIRTLRRLGLGELLASRDGGYLLLTSVHLELVPEPA